MATAAEWHHVKENWYQELSGGQVRECSEGEEGGGNGNGEGAKKYNEPAPNPTHLSCLPTLPVIRDVQRGGGGTSPHFTA